MSGNSFGKNFKIMTFGESHGDAMGVVIDGMPSKLEVDLEELQTQLDKSCLLYTSPSPRDKRQSRMPSSA